MTFLNKLYFVESRTCTGEEVAYVIRLDAEHVIYQAHFPGEPITPGVCILQIGLELLSDAVGETLEISRVKNVKFLSILRPEDGPVRVRIHKIGKEEDLVTAQIEFSRADTPVAKMSLLCQTVAR